MADARPEMIGFQGMPPAKQVLLLPRYHDVPVWCAVRQTSEILPCDWCSRRTGTRWHVTFPNHHVERVCVMCKTEARDRAERYVNLHGADAVVGSSEVAT